jgi:adenylate kinase
MLNLILFGPPGAGKGTQSVKVAEHFGLVHLSTGDIFRANIKGETELGTLAKSYIDKGQLVPDEVTVGMLRGEVEKNAGAKGFVFDGFPRTIPQAQALDALLEEKGASITAVISLEVEEEELVKRLKSRAEVSGRTDDADENIIRNRIQVYKNETFPLKDFYTERGIVKIVNGIGEIEQIFSDICARVEESVS